MNVVVEELKQRISANAPKVRRYKGRVDSYRQNRLFENNQRQFYRGNIWSQSADHKKDAKWLQDVRSEVNVKKTGVARYYHRSLKKILGRMPNWKSPGPDLVQGFRLMSSSSLYER